MTFLPDPSNFGVRLGMMLVSVFLIAFGIFLYCLLYTSDAADDV